jgi:hypothetical protein
VKDAGFLETVEQQLVFNYFGTTGREPGRCDACPQYESADVYRFCAVAFGEKPASECPELSVLKVSA